MKRIKTYNPNIYIFYNNNNKCGLYDTKKDKVIIKPIYKYIDDTYNPNIFKIYDNDKNGLYDISKDKVILEPKYKDILYTYNPNIYIIVDNNYKYGLYDT